MKVHLRLVFFLLLALCHESKEKEVSSKDIYALIQKVSTKIEKLTETQNTQVDRLTDTIEKLTKRIKILESELGRVENETIKGVEFVVKEQAKLQGTLVANQIEQLNTNFTDRFLELSTKVIGLQTKSSKQISLLTREAGNGTKENPSVSCKVLKEHFPALKNGVYWMKLNESETKMYCDMETGGGGWTQVGEAVAKTEAEARDVRYYGLLNDDIKRLHEVVNGRFLLSAKGVKTLQRYISFTQLRFYCYKKYHNRTVDIYTLDNALGHRVVKFLLGQSREWPPPPSCNSHAMLEDDNSYLGSKCGPCCKDWDWSGCRGGDEERMYCLPMTRGRHSGRYSVDLNSEDKASCDDEYAEKHSSIGAWKFFVR